MMEISWCEPEPTHIQERSYLCGYCKCNVGPNMGYRGVRGPYPHQVEVCIYICPTCGKPTYFDEQAAEQVPGLPFGNDVAHLPEDVEKLYAEARNCMSASAYTAAVLCCRKILMHVAVEAGANPGESFARYVEYLGERNYIPAKGEGWVDKIRQMGNEANHEIMLMGREQAKKLISFVEMLLRFNYDFPARASTQSP